MPLQWTRNPCCCLSSLSSTANTGHMDSNWLEPSHSTVVCVNELPERSPLRSASHLLRWKMGPVVHSFIPLQITVFKLLVCAERRTTPTCCWEGGGVGWEIGSRGTLNMGVTYKMLQRVNLSFTYYKHRHNGSKCKWETLCIPSNHYLWKRTI